MAILPAHELDQKYGTSVEGGWKECEVGAAPVNCYDLSATSADLLLDLRNAAIANELLHHCLTNLTLLWVVTEGGAIRFCLEQSFESTSPSRRFPRTRGIEHSDKISHLGHPMLCDGIGRIGGELYLDQGEDDLYWTLSNKSGRYGIGHDRTPDHLEAVALEFASFGVYVLTDFL